MNNVTTNEAERAAYQIASGRKRLEIPFRRCGRFGVLMGAIGKSATVMDAEDGAMCAILKGRIAPLYSLARYICYDAIDKVKEAGEYRHEVKRHVKQYMAEMEKRRKAMIDPPEGRRSFFSVKTLSEKTRARFRADITDEEYFELWEYTGAVAFNKIHAEIYALQWKYEKALKARNAKKAKIIAWLLTASSIIRMYEVEFIELMNTFKRTFGYPDIVLKNFFEPFEPKMQLTLWDKIVECYGSILTPILAECLDERNVEIGLTDIVQKIGRTEETYRLARTAVEENPELFRSKKAWREQLAEIDELVEDLETGYREYKESGLTAKEFFKM